MAQGEGQACLHYTGQLGRKLGIVGGGHPKREHSLALVFLRAGGSLSTAAVLQEATLSPPCAYISSGGRSWRERGNPRASILYNTHSASVVNAESRHRRIEIRTFSEERHAHGGLRKVRA
jgi:hypothetical protein